MGYCHICGDPVPDSIILDHIRVFHPDEWRDVNAALDRRILEIANSGGSDG